MKPHISAVVKPTLGCNESCAHCYHAPEERTSDVIPFEYVAKLTELISREYESAWFVWHGGEPLTVPMSFYRKAIDCQEKCFGGMNRVGNTVQTNGTLLNRRFMSFCRQKRINVGISCEGPFNCVLRELDPEKSVSMLSDRENRYSVSATISKETAGKQCEIYRYYRDRGTNVSFSPVIPAGCAAGRELTPDPDVYADGSIEAFDEWMYDRNATIPLIPHYLYALNYLGDPTPSDCAHSSCLTKWICLYPDGSLYPCAKACPKEFRMGNITEIDSISDAFRSEGFRRILEASVIRRKNCSSCPVYGNCNGGCTVDAYYECGAENNGGNSCIIFRRVFDHVSREIQHAIDSRDVSELNPFLKEAIVGKLINPKITDRCLPDCTESPDTRSSSASW